MTAIITASTIIGYSAAKLGKTDKIEYLGDINKESENSSSSIVLGFHANCCGDVGFDPYNQSQLGIVEITWIDETTVHVIVYDSLNCAYWIEGAGFYIYNDTIHLVYYVGTTDPWVADCVCPHVLSFTLRNLEPIEYKFESEPVFINHPLEHNIE